MRTLALAAAMGLALAALLAPAARAQQPPVFLCAAPAGHVCQFVMQTPAAPINFALPAGERKKVAGVTPYGAKYCVCDPGPVTPDCKALQLDHWCLGQWLDVVPGQNSLIDIDRRFARQ